MGYGFGLEGWGVGLGWVIKDLGEGGEAQNKNNNAIKYTYIFYNRGGKREKLYIYMASSQSFPTTYPHRWKKKEKKKSGGFNDTDFHFETMGVTKLKLLGRSFPRTYRMCPLPCNQLGSTAPLNRC